MLAHHFMVVLGRNVFKYARIIILLLLLLILHFLSLLPLLYIFLPCGDKLVTHHHSYCVASAVCLYIFKKYHVPPVAIKFGNVY
jgi:hypothetical protein